MANHEELILKVLEHVKNGESSCVSDALFGFQKYPLSGSEDDLLVKEIEHDLIEQKLVKVTEAGGSNNTHNGYAYFVISVPGQQYLRIKKGASVSTSTFIIHALSLSSNDPSLAAEGLKNVGLIGYIFTKKLEDTVALNWIRITFNETKEDNLYTTSREKEKISKRRPIEKGILGFVYDSERHQTVRLRRIFNRITLDHLYLTSFITFSDDSIYSEESNDNPMFLLHSKVTNSVPLYLYSNVPEKFKQAVQETKTIFSTHEDIDYSKDERIKELWKQIDEKGLDEKLFSIPRLDKESITVFVSEGPQNFYINLQESKQYFTVRINPAKETGEYIFNEVASWQEVLKYFNEWLDAIIDPGGVAATIASMNEAEGVRFLEGGTPFSIRNEQIKAALDVRIQSEIFFRLINSIPQSENGLLLGLFGKWGRGKTYFWQNLKTVLSSVPKDATKKSGDKTSKMERTPTLYEHVEFHAWKYQDTHASWAYLYEVCIKQFYQRPLRVLFTKKRISWMWLTSIINRFYLNISRVGYFSLILGIITLIYGIIWYFFLDFQFKWDLISSIITFIGLGPLVSALLYYYFYSGTAKKLIKQYFSEPSYQDLLGIQAEIQKELRTLFGVWIPEKQLTFRRIILFVDDIDRCSEDRIIQVIDSLKVMMDDPYISKRIVVLAAIDETVLMRAIKLKYHAMVVQDISLTEEQRKTTLEQLCREYMDKLFLNGFKLGSLSAEDKVDIINSITADRIFFRNDERKGEKFQNAKAPIKAKNIESETTAIDVGSQQVREFESDKAKPDDGKPNVPDAKKFITMLPKEEFEIMDYELEYLLEAVRLLKNATPRAIRIFYYRYLLAKHFKDIVIRKDSDIFNEWVLFTQKKILSFMIVEYSSNRNQQELADELSEISKEQSNVLSRTFLGENFKLSTNLYLAILKVVEIVVPY